jgi:hypothetical protein
MLKFSSGSLSGLALCVLCACTRTEALNGAFPLRPEASPTADGARLDVRLSASFSVVLPGIASTGYQWFLKSDYDASVIELVKQRTGDAPGSRPGDPAPLVGGPTADEIFDFRALKAGETVLTFERYRGWLGPQSTVETRRHSVSVK